MDFQISSIDFGVCGVFVCLFLLATYMFYAHKPGEESV